MESGESIKKFTPPLTADNYSDENRRILAPFFTNLDKSVYVPLIFAPELIGALCSRTSPAPENLRFIFLKEFILPFLNPLRDPKDRMRVLRKNRHMAIRSAI